MSVSVDGQHVHKQKCHLLINMKELHLEFKKLTGMQIGLSKFCSLRPPWCVTVTDSGTHSVCMCDNQQNLKLMVSALPENVDYKDIMVKLVCSLDSRDCMLHHCLQCPGTDKLKSYLEQIFNDDVVDLDDSVQYKQWFHDEQTKLQSVVDSVENFIDSLCSSVDKATDHQFIAKSQSSYLCSTKDSLKPNESAVNLLNFVVNYSFVCQDALQSFHWERSQATQNPFVVYYRSETDGNLK